MKKSTKLIIGLVLVSLVIAAAMYNYAFNGSHRDIANEAATEVVSATDLTTQFLNNETLATSKYLDKVIEIEGIVTSIESTEIILNDQVQISTISDIVSTQTNGVSLTVKGRCVGYDELLEMVKIDQAVLINK